MHHRGHRGELHPLPGRQRGQGRGGEGLHPHAGHHRQPRRGAPERHRRQGRGGEGLLHPHGHARLSYDHRQGQRGIKKTSKGGGHSSSSFIDCYNSAPEDGAKRLEIFTFPPGRSILPNVGSGHAAMAGGPARPEPFPSSKGGISQ